MGMKNYKIDKEFEINVSFKISNVQLTNYQHLSEEQQKEAFKDFIENFPDYILSEILGQYYHQEVTGMTDCQSFRIEPIIKNTTNNG